LHLAARDGESDLFNRFALAHGSDGACAPKEVVASDSDRMTNRWQRRKAATRAAVPSLCMAFGILPLRG